MHSLCPEGGLYINLSIFTDVDINFQYCGCSYGYIVRVYNSDNMLHFRQYFCNFTNEGNHNVTLQCKSKGFSMLSWNVVKLFRR